MRLHPRPSRPGIGTRHLALLLGSALVLATVAVVSPAAPASAGTAVKTFAVGSSGTWTVPQGVSEVQVGLLGGSGGSAYNGSGGGAGERVTTDLDVTAGTQYYVHVGADNGGNGAGGGGPYAGGNGGNGGGASDLRTGTDDLAGRILVAAGGGGGGFYAPGGDAGQPGAGYYDTGAQPGSSSAGGAAENAGNGYQGGDGGLGQGGGGGCCGGGGGGGYYGGGGGEFGGGAGGASYVATGVGLHDSTVALGDRSAPFVTITYIAPTAATASLTDFTLPADGVAQGTLSMTVDDSYGQGVPGDVISVVASDPDVQFGAVTDNLDGTYSVPVTASSTAGDVSVTATDASVSDVSALGVLTLTALPQTAGFTSQPPQNPVVGGDTYTPATSGGASGQPVVISVDASTENAACSVTAGVVSFDHVGNCVLDADQNGNAQYSAAPTVQQTIAVAQGTQTITFDPLSSPAAVGSSQTLSASSTSAGGVVFGVDSSSDSGACAVTGSTVTFTGVGACVVAAAQAATADYPAAQTLTQTVAVQLNATAVSVQLDTSTVVFGQSTTATATVSGTQAGTIQFEVSGSPAGTPVSVSNAGTAISAPLIGAVGAHPVTAVFTPTDLGTYAPATALAQTLTVDQAATTSAVDVTSASVSATVSPVAPGSGTPSGLVIFSIAGHLVGTSPLVNGVATLAYAVPTDSEQQVAAAYLGDASFLPSSNSLSRSDPAISAQVSSAARKSRFGWYRQPVRVTFTCTTNGAALTATCPAPVTLSANGAAQAVSRTISATDGGVATVNVRGIDIDRRAPRVHVVGVRHDRRYFASAPAAKCAAADSLSGIATCKLTHHTRGGRETFTATATDKAGNKSRRSVTVRLLTFAIRGAAFSHGAWTVRLDHTYTLLAVAHRRPRYVDAATAPRRPAGLDAAFHSLGHRRWALGDYMQPQLRSHRYWNIGIKVGHTVHVLRLRVIR
ncbi:invasin domain 3-containing protein [uncultured Jatrophihabitans sp.]|uniref:invasin domain 3-containing protein n=1 Tax=uncultured Jatrophihabitans sp. TaxID=1610747 RepID=UPI0035CA8210